jgi:hypothetical protein
MPPVLAAVAADDSEQPRDRDVLETAASDRRPAVEPHAFVPIMIADALQATTRNSLATYS